MANLNTDNLALKVVNVLVYLWFFGSSLYGSIDGHGSRIAGVDTYISPSAYVFQIWIVISILLLAFVIYQFFDGSKEAVNGVGWRFAIVAVLSGIYAHLWTRRQWVAAFVFSILVMLAVSAIYYELYSHHKPQNALDAVAVHLPFSLWHSWSIVLVWISGFAAFSHDHHGRHPRTITLVFAIIAEIFFTVQALGYVFQSKKGDLAGAIVLSWVLYGIYDHQRNDVIRYFALGRFILTLLAIVKAIYYTFFSREGDIHLGGGELAPLVG